MLQADAFWPTILYFKDFDTNSKFHQDLIKNITDWSEQDPGLQKTNRNGWHSTTDMHTRPEYQPLVDVLYQMQLEIYQEEHLAGEPFLGNMWANVNYPGGRNAIHIHPNSLWSGAYYVATEPGCGNIYFEDPRTPSLMTMPKRVKELPANFQRIVDSEPRAGRLIMFPSWLNHGVRENLSGKNRISVSFNFLQK